MIDALGESLHLLQNRSPLALPMIFAAGLATSAGPCTGVRFVALSALAQGAARPRWTVAAFALGVMSAYLAIGLGAGVVGTLRAWSTPIDAGLAALLALAGAFTLLHDPHAHRARRPPTGANGGAYLIGALSACVVSPCCTPLVAAIAALAAFEGQPLGAALALLAFAAGHVLPLGVATVCGRRCAPALFRRGGAAAGSVIAGTLTLALAALYGMLA